MKKWMLVLFVALFVLPCSREADAAGRKKKGKNAGVVGPEEGTKPRKVLMTNYFRKSRARR